MTSATDLVSTVTNDTGVRLLIAVALVFLIWLLIVAYQNL